MDRLLVCLLFRLFNSSPHLAASIAWPALPTLKRTSSYKVGKNAAQAGVALVKFIVQRTQENFATRTGTRRRTMMKINKLYLLIAWIVSCFLFFEVVAHADDRAEATKLTFSQPSSPNIRPDAGVAMVTWRNK